MWLDPLLKAEISQRTWGEWPMRVMFSEQHMGLLQKTLWKLPQVVEDGPPSTSYLLFKQMGP